MEAQPWDRQPGESLKFYQRFEKFRLMQPVRSIVAVFREETGDNGRKEAPGRWYEESKKWRWEERCQAWDEQQSKELEATIAAEKKKVLSKGYALMHKRIETLNALATHLVLMTGDKNNIWLPDVKSIGSGPTAKRVDLVRFNADLFTVIDKYLASIAAEMGERVKTTKQEITGANGKPLIPDHDEILGALSDEEFEQLKQLQAQALARLEQHDSST